MIHLRSLTRTGILAALVALLVGAVLAAAVWLAVAYERNEKEEALTDATTAAVAEARARLAETENGLRLLAAELPQGGDSLRRFEATALQLLADDPALLRIEMRNAEGDLLSGVDSAMPRPRIDARSRETLGFETTLAKRSAIMFSRAVYSRPYYIQVTDGYGFEVTELAMPYGRGSPDGAMLAIYSLQRLLDRLLPADFQRTHQVYLSEVDGTFVARSSSGLKGAGVYTASAPLELPGVTLLLRVNSLQQQPKLVPNVLAVLLAAVTMALLASGMLLWRDTKLRLKAESELRDQHAFRKAMEDSLITGLRARDLEGRITYVNPAFCQMTGFSADELIGSEPPMPYWVPENQEAHERRNAQVLGGGANRHGYETEFMRRNGDRFPALVFEAPLIDEHGQQAGWMGSILDISDLRRIEELNRRQQEKLQAHARMAMLGEVASALSHELNQPLAAITSYATACENLLPAARGSGAERDDGGEGSGGSGGGSGGGSSSDGRHGAALFGGMNAVRAALGRIRSQSERAGQVIRSVQDFVRRRRIERQPTAISDVVHGVEPLIQLQARKWGARVALRLSERALVLGDRTMLEQVVLNLTRNAAESMGDTPRALRLIELETCVHDCEGQRWVRLSVKDRGRGVDPQLQVQLFNAFVTTKADGLGIGLSLCRSVIESHGGHLSYEGRADGGSIFSCTLPLHEAAADGGDAPAGAAGAEATASIEAAASIDAAASAAAAASSAAKDSITARAEAGAAAET
ncbi:MAG: PAS domain S-box protein [Burkholderiaceae bacterium]